MQIRLILPAVIIGALLTAVACGGSTGNAGTAPAGGSELSGTIRIDGSSTVYPITEVVAYEFGRLHDNVRVTVGVSGTGGGFAKWVNGETDINNASRPIKESELAAAAANGIRPIELAIAYDGIAIVVNQANDWVQCLTVDQLAEIWRAGGNAGRWSDIDPNWPNEKTVLYGPGPDSGTFDYFSEVVIGEDGTHTADYAASEDDNLLVQGVAGDRYALGYFGYAYYVENADRLRAIAIDGGDGCIAPAADTINDGSYSPFSRPLHIFISDQAVVRPEVQEFVKFYLEHAHRLVETAGYVALPASAYEEGMNKLAGYIN